MEDKVRFILADATTTLPLKENLFDKIVAADFIEHITDKQKENLVKEMIRVSNEVGTIVIFTPNEIREFISFLY